MKKYILNNFSICSISKEFFISCYFNTCWVIVSPCTKSGAFITETRRTLRQHIAIRHPRPTLFQRHLCVMSFSFLAASSFGLFYFLFCFGDFSPACVFTLPVFGPSFLMFSCVAVSAEAQHVPVFFSSSSASSGISLQVMGLWPPAKTIPRCRAGLKMISLHSVFHLSVRCFCLSVQSSRNQY